MRAARLLVRAALVVGALGPAFVVANLLATALTVGSSLAAERGRWQLAHDALAARDGIWFMFDAFRAQLDELGAP